MFGKKGFPKGHPTPEYLAYLDRLNEEERATWPEVIQERQAAEVASLYPPDIDEVAEEIFDAIGDLHSGCLPVIRKVLEGVPMYWPRHANGQPVIPPFEQSGFIQPHEAMAAIRAQLQDVDGTIERLIACFDEMLSPFRVSDEVSPFDLPFHGIWSPDPPTNTINKVLIANNDLFSVQRRKITEALRYTKPGNPLRFLLLTPFNDLFHLEFPAPFPDEVRFSHTHIVGSTGSGKTTLLQNLIAWDLRGNASVIVIDPHNQLIPALEVLDLDRRVVVIDPRSAPGINIFDVPQTGSAEEREKAFGGAVKTLAYLFREGDTPPTGKQMMVFQYLTRLMLQRRGNLMDLFNFLIDPTPYLDDIAKMPPLARSFFKDFIAGGAEYKNTAAELRYRLHTFLSVPALERIFSARRTELDIGREMDEGSLILINADQAILGDMHAIFGKVFLGLIMQAARQRGEYRHPTFLYIDEAHRFLDEQVNDLLTDARKFKVGLTLAHQHLGQIHSADIKGALQGTAVKFAGGVRSDDARALASDMRTSAEFLLGLPKYRFGVHMQQMTAAVAVAPDADPLADFDTVSDDEVRRRRPQRSVQPEPEPVSPAPESRVTDEW